MSTLSWFLLVWFAGALAFAQGLPDIQPKALLHVVGWTLRLNDWPWGSEELFLDLEVASLDPGVPLRIRVQNTQWDSFTTATERPQGQAVARVGTREVTGILKDQGLEELLSPAYAYPGDVSNALRRSGPAVLANLAKEGLLDAKTLRPRWNIHFQWELELPAGARQTLTLKLDSAWQTRQYPDWNALASSLPESLRQGPLWAAIQTAASELPPQEVRVNQPENRTLTLGQAWFKGWGRGPDRVEVRWTAHRNFLLLEGPPGRMQGGTFSGSWTARLGPSRYLKIHRIHP